MTCALEWHKEGLSRSQIIELQTSKNSLIGCGHVYRDNLIEQGISHSHDQCQWGLNDSVHRFDYKSSYEVNAYNELSFWHVLTIWTIWAVLKNSQWLRLGTKDICSDEKSCCWGTTRSSRNSSSGNQPTGPFWQKREWITINDIV